VIRWVLFAASASPPPPSWGDPAPWVRSRPSKERLRPGRKLGEANLAKAFGTTRIHIRQMPAHLASRCIVTQYVNRAALVIRPAVEGAHKVIAARHVVETATVAGAIERLDASTRDRQQHHMRRERADRWASVSLRADFHVLVGKMVVLDFYQRADAASLARACDVRAVGLAGLFTKRSSAYRRSHVGARSVRTRSWAGSSITSISASPRRGNAIRRHRHHLPKKFGTAPLGAQEG
jgi:DNA-binding GntR family transcriptional regulator